MIGVYDSGLGGLLELNKVIADNPFSDILYLGDQKNAPYGLKTKEELIKIFEDNLAYFKSKGVKDIIIACNTLCSVIDYDKYQDFNLYNIINKTCDEIKIAKDKNILVFSTPLTAKLNKYVEYLNELGYQNVYNYGFDKLTNLIEAYASLDEIKDYLFNEFKKISFKPDAIILACTHYPIVKDIFEEYYKCDIYDSRELDYHISSLKEDAKLYIHMTKNENLDRFLSQYVKKEVNYI